MEVVFILLIILLVEVFLLLQGRQLPPPGSVVTGQHLVKVPLLEIGASQTLSLGFRLGSGEEI